MAIDVASSHHGVSVPSPFPFTRTWSKSRENANDHNNGFDRSENDASLTSKVSSEHIRLPRRSTAWAYPREVRFEIRAPWSAPARYFCRTREQALLLRRHLAHEG